MDRACCALSASRPARAAYWIFRSVVVVVVGGDYGLLTLTADDSTTVSPRPKVPMEHLHEIIACEPVGTVNVLLPCFDDHECQTSCFGSC